MHAAFGMYVHLHRILTCASSCAYVCVCFLMQSVVQHCVSSVMQRLV